MKVAVVVASKVPTGWMSVTLKHYCPPNSVDISVLVPSCAILGQYRTTPSGDTAKTAGRVASLSLAINQTQFRPVCQV